MNFINFQSIFYAGACGLFIYVAYMYTKILSTLNHENSILKRPLRILLDEEDFKCLVRGGILEVAYFKDSGSAFIKIALSDIGFDRMDRALVSAENAENIGKNHNKIIS